MKDTFKGKKEKENNSLVLFLCGRGNSNSQFVHFIYNAYKPQETTVNRKSALDLTFMFKEVGFFPSEY